MADSFYWSCYASCWVGAKFQITSKWLYGKVIPWNETSGDLTLARKLKVWINSKKNYFEEISFGRYSFQKRFLSEEIPFGRDSFLLKFMTNIFDIIMDAKSIFFHLSYQNIFANPASVCIGQLKQQSFYREIYYHNIRMKYMLCPTKFFFNSTAPGALVGR